MKLISEMTQFEHEIRLNTFLMGAVNTAQWVSYAEKVMLAMYRGKNVSDKDIKKYVDLGFRHYQQHAIKELAFFMMPELMFTPEQSKRIDDWLKD